MTKLLEQIESRLALCAKATSGPWEMHVSLARVELFMGIHTFRSPTFDYMRSLERAEKDGTFCVQSRNQREGELAALRLAVEALGKLSVRSFKGTDCANYPTAEFASVSEMVRECLEAIAQIKKFMEVEG